VYSNVGPHPTRQGSFFLRGNGVEQCNAYKENVATAVQTQLKIVSKVNAYMYSSSQMPRCLTCHIRSQSVTCQLAEVAFPTLPQPIKTGKRLTRFIDPERMNGQVGLVG